MANVLIEGILALAFVAKRQVTQVLFYLGEEVLSFGERNFALPVSMLWAMY